MKVSEVVSRWCSDCGQFVEVKLWFGRWDSKHRCPAILDDQEQQ